MLNFEYSQPTNIIFGKGAQYTVGEHVKKFGKNALVVYGSSRIRQSGLLDAVEKSLTDNGVKFELLGGVKANPILSTVQKGIEICKNNQIDFVLAVGGGSVIDSVKAIAIGAVYDGDVWDFYTNKAVPEGALPVGTILTIAAAGSEASTGSVITNDQTHYKLSVNTNYMIPKFSILNPELTFSVSRYQTACGGVDMIMHVLERYFTTTKHVALGDYMCEAVVLAVKEQLPIVLENPNDYDARAEIMWAGTIAHNNLLSAGRTGEWTSHRIGHELSAIYDLAHGATLSIIFPAWMTHVYEADIDRFYRFAVRVMGIDPTVLSKEETVLAGIDALKDLFKSFDMPVSLADADITDNRFEEMAEKALAYEGIGGLIELTKEDIIAIYELAK